MEHNKEQAEKCRDIGATSLRKSDFPRAAKFLQKSLNLYPLPGVKSLLAQAEHRIKESATASENTNSDKSTNGTSGTNGSAPSSRAAPSRPSTTARQTPPTPTGADGRSYTPEQVRLVKTVLEAKQQNSGGIKPHYKVLSLPVDCTEVQIKKAYRKSALKLHPDKNSAPQADEAFKAVGLAYATLSDPEKRQVYDRWGEEDPDNRGAGGMRGHAGPQFRRGGGHDVSPEEIFNMFFGGGGGMRGGMGGGFGGPGFRVYSTGGSQGQQFRQGRQNQQAQPQEEQGGWKQMMQLLPLLMFLLLSFLNFPGESAGNQYFRLTQTTPYINPVHTRLTEVKDIPYFVTDQFLRTINRDRYQLAQVERMVESGYHTYLKGECQNQKVYKQRLEQQARHQRGLIQKDRDRLMEKATTFELTRCQELKDLFGLKR